MASLATAPPVGDARSRALELANVLYEKSDGIAYVTINRPKVPRPSSRSGRHSFTVADRANSILDSHIS